MAAAASLSESRVSAARAFSGVIQRRVMGGDAGSLSPEGRGLGERVTVASLGKLAISATFPLTPTLSRKGRGGKALFVFGSPHNPQNAAYVLPNPVGALISPLFPAACAAQVSR